MTVGSLEDDPEDDRDDEDDEDDDGDSDDDDDDDDDDDHDGDDLIKKILKTKARMRNDENHSSFGMFL